MTEDKIEIVLADELAEAAGVSGFAIRDLLRRGTLKGEKRGGVWMISKAEARRYLENRKGRTRAFFGRKKRGK